MFDPPADVPAEIAQLVASDRPLTREEVVRVAQATEQALDLAELAWHREGSRVCRQLYATDHYEAWLICWQDDGDTGWHDHECSLGGVHIVQGELVEENICLRPGSESWSQRRSYVAGEAFSFDERHIHRMTHAGGGPAISVHCYSPPLVAMGQYELDDGGVLRRESISGDAELVASRGF